MLNFSTRKIDNPKLAIFSPSMQAIINGPRGSMASKVRNLLTTAMNVPVDSDSALAEIIMVVVQLAMATLLINGEFAQNPVASISGEANTLVFDAYLPQAFGNLTAAIQVREQTTRNEGLMGLSDNMKTKPQTTIEKLGQITGPQSIQSAIVNINRVGDAVFNIKAMEANGGAPILLQLFKGYWDRYRTKK